MISAQPYDAGGRARQTRQRVLKYFNADKAPNLTSSLSDDSCGLLVTLAYDPGELPFATR